jgi:hypothetical protein
MGAPPQLHLRQSLRKCSRRSLRLPIRLARPPIYLQHRRPSLQHPRRLRSRGSSPHENYFPRQRHHQLDRYRQQPGRKRELALHLDRPAISNSRSQACPCPRQLVWCRLWARDRSWPGGAVGCADSDIYTANGWAESSCCCYL